MKRCVTLLVGLLLFAAAGCTTAGAPEEETASGGLDRTEAGLCAGTIADISGEEGAQVITVDSQDWGSVQFVLTEDTAYRQHFTYTGESLEGGRDLLYLGAPAEVQWERDSGGGCTACTVTLFNHISDVAQPTLTLATLEDLAARRGEELTWEDLSPYYSQEVGSGLYILRYPMDGGYALLVGGGSMDQTPLYVHLISDDHPEDPIDVRYENMDAFLTGQ